MNKFWQTSKRQLSLKKTLIMAILNLTPDSFSDGGKFNTVENALAQAENLIKNGADIIDVGGESTRPKSKRVSEEEEKRRVLPIIEKISREFDIPISIDTSKSNVAQKAIESGAEIINDVSGLVFDEHIADIAVKYNTGLILMHLRGKFETMHQQAPVADILQEVSDGFRKGVEKAHEKGVKNENIVLDVGIGFSKTFEQNLELIAKLDILCENFKDFPILIGTSRKSFIGKVLDEPDPENRLFGSISSAAIAVFNGAKIVRVHDVRETVEAVKIVDAIREYR